MSRIDVLKTYKIFIGGKFPRTESGRFLPLKNKDGDLIANICLSSRKDFRNAVVSARNTQKQWENTTAFLKSFLEDKQIFATKSLSLFFKGKNLPDSVLGNLPPINILYVFNTSILLIIQILNMISIHAILLLFPFRSL